jgi:hypothetical protein
LADERPVPWIGACRGALSFGEAGSTAPIEEVFMNEQKKAETKQTGFGETASEKDKKLPENSQKSLDKKLDHALEETFPTSDPVSVKITK